MMPPRRQTLALVEVNVRLRGGQSRRPVSEPRLMMRESGFELRIFLLGGAHRSSFVAPDGLQGCRQNLRLRGHRESTIRCY